MTTNIEVHGIAEQVARATVKKLFLGVNADDSDAVIAVQKDFAHLRAWREASDAVKHKSLGTAVIIIVTGLLALIWLAISKH